MCLQFKLFNWYFILDYVFFSLWSQLLLDCILSDEDDYMFDVKQIWINWNQIKIIRWVLTIQWCDRNTYKRINRERVEGGDY